MQVKNTGTPLTLDTASRADITEEMTEPPGCKP